MAPIQLWVATTETLLKPGSILLTAPTCLKREDTVQKIWPWKIKALHCQWVTLIAPWGKGLEVNLQVFLG